MANVSFDSVDLSTYGLSVRGITGRGIASFVGDKVTILGREQIAETGAHFDESTETGISGFLSAPLPPNPYYSRSGFQERLDNLKDKLDPDLGYKKLVVTGDRPDVWRWCRLNSLSVEEEPPVFHVPFAKVSLVFGNLEPFWRKTHSTVTSGTVPTAIPNAKRKTRPLVKCTVGTTISAPPINLFTIDNLTVVWNGTASGDGLASAGDIITIDCENLTVTKRAGAGAQHDVIRYYDYSGTGAYDNSGFPIVARGGSSVSARHTNISSITFDYDELYL